MGNKVKNKVGWHFAHEIHIILVITDIHKMLDLNNKSPKIITPEKHSNDMQTFGNGNSKQ